MAWSPAAAGSWSKLCWPITILAEQEKRNERWHMQNNQYNLRSILENHILLLDTSFAMQPGFHQFTLDFTDIFQANPLRVPLVVAKELNRLSSSPNNPERKKLAQDAVTIINSLIKRSMAELRGEVGDQYVDLVLQRVVEQHLLTHNMAVLTNDVPLMKDLHAKLNKFSVRTERSIVVIKLHGRRQTPQLFEPGGYREDSADQSRQHRVSRSGRQGQNPEPFRIATSLSQGLDTPLKASTTLDAGSRVLLSDGNPIFLGRKLHEGGEGAIFEVENWEEGVCKIYFSNRLTVGRKDKITRMLTRKVDNPAICWPLDHIRDEGGVFRGFVMRRAWGAPLDHTLFIPNRFLEQRPEWTRRESVRLAQTILRTIEQLHRMNVLIGDVNPQNIILSGPDTVFLVDCDSFQVEGYPCPVGTVNFSAPEIQGSHFGKLLRTNEHELFAVATLLFMILLPGKPPYSHQGGADGASNIRQMNFPYTRDRNSSSRRAPQGVWTFCWSHLSTELKDAFTWSFNRENFGKPRVTIAEWLHLLERYSKVLSVPENTFVGPKPRVGFDLGIMPHNPRYPKGTEGNIPQDGKSAYDRLLERMLQATNRQAR